MLYNSHCINRRLRQIHIRVGGLLIDQCYFTGRSNCAAFLSLGLSRLSTSLTMHLGNFVSLHLRKLQYSSRSNRVGLGFNTVSICLTFAVSEVSTRSAWASRIYRNTTFPTARHISSSLQTTGTNLPLRAHITCKARIDRKDCANL